MKSILTLILLAFFGANNPNTKESTWAKIYLNKSILPLIFPSYELVVARQPEIEHWKMMYGSFADFNIGIYDKNNNGIFGDIDQDVMFVTPKYETQYAPYNPLISTSAFVVQTKNIFKVDSICYEVEVRKTDNNIVYIKSAKVEPGTIYNKWLITTTPDFSFKSIISGHAVNLLEEKKKCTNLLVVFYANYCEPCRTKLIKLNKKHADKMTIIVSVAEDDVNGYIKFSERNKLNFDAFESPEYFHQLFNQNGYPYAILFDEQNKISYNQEKINEMF
jgi:thiol-disulfide isomerase/thioredoxin